MHIQCDYLEILSDSQWEHPQYYFGFSPEGDYLIASKDRDSDILSESNYSVALNILTDAVKGESAECQEERDENGYIIRPDWVYEWRARCSLVGWIDYLMVRKDAPESVLIAAAEIVSSLADYPVLSDDDYSDRKYQAVERYWEEMSLKERIEWCKDAGESIFAARNAHPCGNVLYRLLESDIAN